MGILEPPLIAETSHKVEPTHLASTIGSGQVRVFATAMMIAGMEGAAVQAVQPYLEQHETTVGTHVNVSHDAATPLGMIVHFRASLERVNGRRLSFKVEAWDEKGPIGAGTHERAIVNKADFEERTQKKLAERQAGDQA